MRFREHLVCLAYSGRGSDIDAQARPIFVLDLREQGVGARTLGRYRCAHFLIGILRIEREIQLQHVDDGLAEEAELPCGSICLDETTDVCFGDAAFAGHARTWNSAAAGEMCGIESGGGRGDQVNRHWCVRVFLAGGFDVCLDSLDELLVGRSQLAACRVGCVVTRSSSGRTRPEVPRRSKTLPDDARTHDCSVALDQLAVGLVGKRELGDGGDRERIRDAKQQRGHDRHTERGDEVASDVHASLHYASRSAVITTSMALIPMNGMMTPPTP